MELHSVASGLHGSLARPEDYSRVARSRSNSQSYAKCQVPPNRGKEMLLLRKMPASYGFGEIFGVLVLAKSDLRSDSEDAAAGSHEKRLDVSTIFAIVNLCDLLPDGTIFDFLGGAFEDYSLVGFFGADHAVRVGGDVLGLARTRPGAEPERVLPPDAPNKHEMRPAPGARGGNPI